METSNTYNANLLLQAKAWVVEEVVKLPESVHPQITVEELIACEDALRADKRVVELIAAIGEHAFVSRTAVSSCESSQESRLSSFTLTAGVLATTNVSRSPGAFSSVSCLLVWTRMRTSMLTRWTCALYVVLMGPIF